MILILPFPAERGGRGVSGSPEVTQGRPQRGGGSRGGKGTRTTHSRCNQSGWAFTYSRGRPCRISLGKGPTANKQSERTLPPPQKWILTYFRQEGLNRRLGLRRTAFPPPEQVAEGLTRVTPPREGLVTP